jgi:hypothetical protein
LKGVAERIDLRHHEIDSASGLGPDATDRIIPFSQRAQKIR